MDPILGIFAATVTLTGTILGCFALLLPAQSRPIRGAGVYLGIISVVAGGGPLIFFWPGQDISQCWFIAFCVPVALGLLAIALCLRGRSPEMKDS